MADEAHLRRLPGALRRGTSPLAFRSGVGPVIEVRDEACLISRLNRKMPTIASRTAPAVDIVPRLTSRRFPMLYPLSQILSTGIPSSLPGMQKSRWRVVAGGWYVKHLAQLSAARLP